MKAFFSNTAPVLGSLVVLLRLLPLASSCGFFVSNFDATLDAARLEKANYFNQHRGPDATNVRVLNGWTFLHNLLSMTGEVTLQPFVSKDESVVTVFNGEIYNYQDLAKEHESSPYPSDGYSILPSYNQWGTNFVQHFHGEFAVVLVDFEKDLMVLSADVFSTKPIWYAKWACQENSTTTGVCFATASYESTLTGMGAPPEARKMIDPNVALVFSLKDYSIIDQYPIFEFDLNQHKTSTENWETAFLEAVRIRTSNVKHKVFVGLSSGYDSGAITLAVELLQKPSYMYYVRNHKEDQTVVQERIDYCTNGDASILDMDDQAVKDEKTFLNKHAEKFLKTGVPLAQKEQQPETCYLQKYIPYTGRNKKNKHRLMHDRTAALINSYIARDVRKRDGLVFLSGGGADETISDYSKDGVPFVKEYSNFNGIFPNDLKDLFPWCIFYHGIQRDILMFTEITGGAHGIETRYPFLDPKVVQEYLWLSADLKNSEYKRPIADFLRKHDYPNMYGGKARYGQFTKSKNGTQTATFDKKAMVRQRNLETVQRKLEEHVDSAAQMWEEIQEPEELLLAQQLPFVVGVFLVGYAMRRRRRKEHST